MQFAVSCVYTCNISEFTIKYRVRFSLDCIFALFLILHNCKMGYFFPIELVSIYVVHKELINHQFSCIIKLGY